MTTLTTDPSGSPQNPAIERLKAHAKRRLRASRAGEPGALALLARDPEARGLPPGSVQLKHALSAIARQLGFRSWMHAQRVLRNHDEPDLGTLLVPDRCFGFTNQWFVRPDEARAAREASGGYLLGYRRQRLVVSAEYVERLGLDPESPMWAAMDFDWTWPRAVEPRSQLYAQLIDRELS